MRVTLYKQLFVRDTILCQQLCGRKFPKTRVNISDWPLGCSACVRLRTVDVGPVCAGGGARIASVINDGCIRFMRIVCVRHHPRSVSAVAYIIYGAAVPSQSLMGMHARMQVEPNVR